MDPDLTLDKAMKSVRQREAVKEQHQQLQGGRKTSPILVDEIRRTARGGTRECRDTVKDHPQKPLRKATDSEIKDHQSKIRVASVAGRDTHKVKGALLETPLASNATAEVIIALSVYPSLLLLQV